MNPALAYQVCYRPAKASGYRTTGLALHLQTDLIAVEINDVAAGDGHRATAVRSRHNHMCVRVHPSVLSSTLGAGPTTAITVAVISSELDCRAHAQNPASGHLNGDK